MPAANSLKARALQWLAQREHSRVELRRKLVRHVRSAVQSAARSAASSAVSSPIAGSAGPGARNAEPVPPAGPDELDDSAVAEQVDAVLDWLEAHRYLSAERFVESRIHVRASRFGNLRIRQELQQHALAIPPELAQSLGASEVERARAVRARRFAHWPADASERARQARFLIGRGFSSEAVRAALREPVESA